VEAGWSDQDRPAFQGFANRFVKALLAICSPGAQASGTAEGLAQLIWRIGIFDPYYLCLTMQIFT
jgi:hypothetical protein